MIKIIKEDIPEFDKVVDECLFGEDKLNLKPFDLEAAINIMWRYEQCHIALMTTPLDVSNVVARNNLATNLQNSKGNPLL